MQKRLIKFYSVCLLVGWFVFSAAACQSSKKSVENQNTNASTVISENKIASDNKTTGRSKTEVDRANSNGKTRIRLSRLGPPQWLNLEFEFSKNPKCAQYDFDVEVFKNDSNEKIYSETKSINLKEIKCYNCLPSIQVNSCGNPCRLINTHPVWAIVSLDLTPHIQARSKLRVHVKNFRGTRILHDPMIETAEIPEATSPDINRRPIQLSECMNEIDDAMLVLKFPEDFLNP